jgi:hypothetical protein
VRIDFARSGGFAGIRFAAKIDTAELPPDEAHKLEEMVEASDFFNLPTATSRPMRGADRLEYRVTVEKKGRQHTVTMTDMGVPEALQPLLDYLTKVAKTRGRT